MDLPESIQLYQNPFTNRNQTKNPKPKPMSAIVELILKERSGVSREDIQKVNNVINKYEITLPEKMPSEYEGKSVFEAYLMAWYKKEKDLKPAEKKLIKEVIKFAAKDEREAAKEAEKAEKAAAKEAEKAAKAAEKAAAKEAEKAAKAAEKAAKKKA
jgi:hypothetical protein